MGQESSNRWRFAVPIFSEGFGFPHVFSYILLEDDDNLFPITPGALNVGKERQTTPPKLAGIPQTSKLSLSIPTLVQSYVSTSNINK